MSDGVKIFFSPKHPVIWFAEYHPSIKELKIPKCKNCNELIKVKKYDNVICDKCQTTDITWAVEEGAMVIPINHFILEFDENGESIVNYRHLPLDGMLKFGLLDPSTSVAYGIELLTGYITIGDFTSGTEPFYLATGVNTDTVASNLIKISDAIITGEAELELCYAKRAIIGGEIQVSVVNFETISKFNMPPNNFTIDNVAIGYTCQTSDLNFEVMIRIDCNNHLPYFTSKATPITK